MMLREEAGVPLLDDMFGHDNMSGHNNMFIFLISGLMAATSAKHAASSSSTTKHFSLKAINDTLTSRMYLPNPRPYTVEHLATSSTPCPL